MTGRSCVYKGNRGSAIVKLKLCSFAVWEVVWRGAAESWSGGRVAVTVEALTFLKLSYGYRSLYMYPHARIFGRGS